MSELLFCQESSRAEGVSKEAAELHSLLETAKVERTSQESAISELRGENSELMTRIADLMARNDEQEKNLASVLSRSHGDTHTEPPHFVSNGEAGIRPRTPAAGDVSAVRARASPGESNADPGSQLGATIKGTLHCIHALPYSSIYTKCSNHRSCAAEMSASNRRSADSSEEEWRTPTPGSPHSQVCIPRLAQLWPAITPTMLMTHSTAGSKCKTLPPFPIYH